MMYPKIDEFDWPGLWADLLKGVGTGLLEHDGSRISQAALAGLKVFDEARQRRNGIEERDPADTPRIAERNFRLLQAMSPAERAAFHQLSLSERDAYAAELAEAESGAQRRVGGAPAGTPPVRGPRSVGPLPFKESGPLTVDPFEGWYLAPALPFGPNNALRLASYRR